MDKAGAVHELKGRGIGQGRPRRLIATGLGDGEREPRSNPGSAGEDGVVIGRGQPGRTGRLRRKVENAPEFVLDQLLCFHGYAPERHPS